MKKDKVYIIAEAGVNHNGDINIAYKLIDAAVEAGVDAVKFQTFKANKLVSKYADMASYQKRSLGNSSEQLKMLEKLELKFDDFIKLKKYCDEKGIEFLSSPFDLESIKFLEKLMPYYKIPSGEIVNYPYLRKIAEKNKPIIMSTGMATLSEVEKALDTIYEVNNNVEIYLLHCTTNYPTPYEEVNLKAMITLKEAFKLPVGYSDHTLGIEVPIAAVAMGAQIIEKHFTLDKNLPGPDHKASLEPHELKEMVKSIRNIEKALGNGIKKPNKSEIEIKEVARKKLVAARDIKNGEIITEKDISIKRSNIGLSPEYYEIIIGKKLLKKIKEDEGFTWNHFMEE
ncbi:N-acetylneuraminate synthase [Marinitoga aeolica]|uniref:N-acetylneuraminate synthase n=1 Tax=Marinitoga aeolica TaxID=2809031 RepID=A0ABY8PTS5_9BACT|nr:N-acetylneuraminate synthase [Marinitoga aeolica]WGS66034.1 N-acetylneuraminate synthase [Marinitoga aeolica]